MQADRTLDGSQGGLGIGLTLVRRLLEKLGGGVEAFSTCRPGEGSEFVVRLLLLSESKNAPGPRMRNEPKAIPIVVCGCDS
jgi:signal transduction histidine kinase